MFAPQKIVRNVQGRFTKYRPIVVVYSTTHAYTHIAYCRPTTIMLALQYEQSSV